MLKVGNHAILARFMCPDLAMALRAALYAARIEPQGVLQRNPLPVSTDFYLTFNLEMGHEAEYALPGQGRKPYSGMPYSN